MAASGACSSAQAYCAGCAPSMTRARLFGLAAQKGVMVDGNRLLTRRASDESEIGKAKLSGGVIDVL